KEQRKTLYWLAVGLRLVNRLFYFSHFHERPALNLLPAYDSLIRPPYSSDPFPHTHSQSSPRSSLASLQRETSVLDHFIALKVREDVWIDDSSLHLERDESFTDLFNLMQPRSRLEDLIREYGVSEGVIYVDRRRPRTPGASAVDLRAADPAGSSFWRMTTGKGKGKAVAPVKPPSQKVTINPLAFSALSVSFSSRRAGLVLTTFGGRSTGSKRTVVEVTRTRDEQLEVAARRLVWELRDWLVDGVDGL
ncbi:hypothetical protein B0H13DRAFT_1620173, partial [Mycena leptocephala]